MLNLWLKILKFNLRVLGLDGLGEHAIGSIVFGRLVVVWWFGGVGVHSRLSGSVRRKISGFFKILYAYSRTLDFAAIEVLMLIKKSKNVKCAK